MIIMMTKTTKRRKNAILVGVAIIALLNTWLIFGIDVVASTQLAHYNSPPYDVILICDDDIHSVLAGNFTTFGITVINNGTVQDTIKLECATPEDYSIYNSTFDITRVTLDPGDFQTVNLTVWAYNDHIPSIGVVIVRGTSEGDPSTFTTISLTVNIININLSPTIVPPSTGWYGVTNETTPISNVTTFTANQMDAEDISKIETSDDVRLSTTSDLSVPASGYPYQLFRFGVSGNNVTNITVHWEGYGGNVFIGDIDSVSMYVRNFSNLSWEKMANYGKTPRDSFDKTLIKNISQHTNYTDADNNVYVLVIGPYGAGNSNSILATDFTCVFVNGTNITQPINHAPAITSVTSSKTTATPGDQVSINVVASDTDLDVLTYLYTATGGNITGNGSAATWTAPSLSGTYGITVSVSDGNLTVHKSIMISVTCTKYAGGSGPNNYTKIQDAINAASPGDTVYVYNGTYNEQIAIDKTISLTGESAQNTIITGSGVRGSTGIYVKASHVNVNNVKVDNFYYGIFLYNSNNDNISSNTIMNSSTGIQLHGSNNIIITSNAITNNSNYGIFLYGSNNNNVSSNTITNCGSYGIFLYSYPSSNNNNIASNTITNSGDGICLDSSSLGSDSSSNNNIVSNTVINSSIIILGNNIVSNNTINGKPVLYYKNINATVSPQILDNVNANGIILYNCSGFVIRNTRIEYGSIVLSQSSYTDVASNTISNSSYGVLLDYGSNNNITSNTVANCSYGVYLSGYDSKNDNIISNTITNSSQHGIYLSSSKNSNIVSNTITNSGDCGVYLHGSCDNNIASNTVTNSNNYGIYLDGANNNIVSNNIYANKKYGIYSGITHFGDTAINNWWGSASGPYNATANPSGTGDNITDGISFIPWATSPFNVTTTTLNIPPIASIVSIAPNPVTYGQTITFVGSGSDLDGTIIEYRWSIDNVSIPNSIVSTESTFTNSSLPVGDYRVSLFVKDNNDTWSNSVSVVFKVVAVDHSAAPSIPYSMKVTAEIIGIENNTSYNKTYFNISIISNNYSSIPNATILKNVTLEVSQYNISIYKVGDWINCTLWYQCDEFDEWYWISDFYNNADTHIYSGFVAFESVVASKAYYNVSEQIDVTVKCRRGNDMLNVVWDGNITLVVIDSKGAEIFNETKAVSILSSGGVSTIYFDFGINTIGNYSIKARLNGLFDVSDAKETIVYVTAKDNSGTVKEFIPGFEFAVFFCIIATTFLIKHRRS